MANDFPDDEDTEELVLEVDESRPRAAFGLITVFDGERAVHQVTINDGVDAVLRSRGSVYTSTVEPTGSLTHWWPEEADVTLHRVMPPLIRVGDLVALMLPDVVLSSPPEVTPEGAVLDRRTQISLRCRDSRAMLLDGPRGSGRRTIAGALHARRGLTGRFVEVDGAAFATEPSGIALLHLMDRFFAAASAADDGTLYVTNVDRMAPSFHEALITVSDRYSDRKGGSFSARVVASAGAAVADPHRLLGERLAIRMPRIVIPALADRALIVPFIVEATLAKLPVRTTLSATFIEEMLRRVLSERLEVADVVRLTELAVSRARMGRVARLAREHLGPFPSA